MSRTPDKVGVISRTLLYIEISTASGPINGPMMGPRSLLLAVLIVLGRPLERYFTAKAAEINGFLFEDRFI
jgi:hypothetical protein